MQPTKKIFIASVIFYFGNTLFSSLQAYTVSFYFQNLTDGFGGPLANGGLLYIQNDRGTGFAPGPVPGAFVTGDDFRLVEPVDPFPWSDLPITSVGSSFSVIGSDGEAYMSFQDMTYSSPGLYTDLNSEVYPVGSLWRFIFFPPLTGLNPSSPASAVTAGMPYAVATYVFDTRPANALNVGMLSVDTWEWYLVVPEPHVAKVSALAILAATALLLKNLRKTKSQPKNNFLA